MGIWLHLLQRGRETIIEVVLVSICSDVVFRRRWLPCHCSRLVGNSSLVDLVWDFFRQKLDMYLDFYLRKIFTLMRDGTVGFLSVTSNFGHFYSATLCQDVSSILMHLDVRMLGLASSPSATTSFLSSGPNDALLSRSLANTKILHQ